MQRPLLGLLAAFVSALAFSCSSAALTKSSVGSEGETPGGDEPGSEAPVGDGGRDPATVLDGGSLPVTSQISVQVQPTDQGAALLAAIKGAKTSVHMTMYLLTDNATIKALGDLKAAGKEVKVILNETFPEADQSNQSAYDTLKGRGVDVVWAPPGYAYTHAKTIVLDGKTLIAMTMNMTYTSPTSNREYIATDTDPADVADAETIFAADFANTSVSVRSKLVLSPQAADALDARTRLKALIDGAQTSVDVESQSISDKVLVGALIAAKQAGLTVRVVYDSSFAGSPAQQEAITQMVAGGVEVRGVQNPDMHAKAIVADGKLAFIGSQNLTANALLNNREVGVITDNAAAVSTVASTIAGDFASGTAP